MVGGEDFGAKKGVDHWVGHMDDESGDGWGVCTKQQLFSETNKNTNDLSVVLQGQGLTPQFFVYIGTCSVETS